MFDSQCFTYFGINKAFLVEDISEVEIFSEDEKRMIIEYRNSDKTTQDAIRRLLAYAKGLSNDH